MPTCKDFGLGSSPGDISMQIDDGDMIAGEWPEAMTFEPTMEEFANLTNLLTYMESKGAHKAGIAKIKTPSEWIARAKGYNPSEIDLEIPGPVRQTLAPTDTVGSFQSNSSKMPPLPVEDYRKLATRRNYVTPPHQSYEELETLYWESMTNDKADAPIYGADVAESITDPEQKIWNINRLESALTEVMEEQIPGVNMPYLYFGMWRATFSWHVEDMDLYGVNLLHFGAPKTWYCIPPMYGYKLEKLGEKLFPGMSRACFNLFRHKAVMLAPDLLEECGIRVHKMVQEERDMIIVFPHAYHSGFNHGFNIAEATNFALPRWVEYGKRFRGCLCTDRDTAVTVNMDPFVQRFQPERFNDWKKGTDFALHPEDPQYLKDAYSDAQKKLSPVELEKFKNHVMLKRDIPDWFLEGGTQEELYPDRVDAFAKYDFSDLITDWTMKHIGNGWSPRHRSAMRRLLENPDTCYIKVKPLRKLQAKLYMQKRRKQEKYEQEALANMSPLDPRSHYSTGKVSGGFKGANLANMLDKKAQKVCVKRHRFKACKKCVGCRTPNCGKCRSCQDMPIFGGMGMSKQKCMERNCNNPVMQSCDMCKWNVSVL